MLKGASNCEWIRQLLRASPVCDMESRRKLAPKLGRIISTLSGSALQLRSSTTVQAQRGLECTRYEMAQVVESADQCVHDSAMILHPGDWPPKLSSLSLTWAPAWEIPVGGFRALMGEGSVTDLTVGI